MLYACMHACILHHSSTMPAQANIQYETCMYACMHHTAVTIIQWCRTMQKYHPCMSPGHNFEFFLLQAIASIS
jgi:hypothetical protein